MSFSNLTTSPTAVIFEANHLKEKTVVNKHSSSAWQHDSRGMRVCLSQHVSFNSGNGSIDECEELTLRKSQSPDRALRSNALFLMFYRHPEGRLEV